MFCNPRRGTKINMARAVFLYWFPFLRLTDRSLDDRILMMLIRKIILSTNERIIGILIIQMNGRVSVQHLSNFFSPTIVRTIQYAPMMTPGRTHPMMQHVMKSLFRLEKTCIRLKCRNTPSDNIHAYLQSVVYNANPCMK